MSSRHASMPSRPVGLARASDRLREVLRIGQSRATDTETREAVGLIELIVPFIRDPLELQNVGLMLVECGGEYEKSGNSVLKKRTGAFARVEERENAIDAGNRRGGQLEGGKEKMSKPSEQEESEMRGMPFEIIEKVISHVREPLDIRKIGLVLRDRGGQYAELGKSVLIAVKKLFWAADALELKEQAANGELYLVDTIDLGGSPPPDYTKEQQYNSFVTLARRDTFCALSTLSFSKYIIGNALMKAISEAIGTYELTYLEFDECGIEDEGLKAFSREMASRNGMKSLKHLFFSNNSITDAGIVAFCASFSDTNAFMKQLSSLSFKNNRVGNDGMAALARVMRFMPTMSGLYLSNNQIGDHGMVALAEAMRFRPTMNYLGLHKNRIGDNGMVALAEAMRFAPTMTHLSLHENQIGDMGMEAISHCVRDHRMQNLEFLSLRDNAYSGLGIKAFTDAVNFLRWSLDSLHYLSIDGILSGISQGSMRSLERLDVHGVDMDFINAIRNKNTLPSLIDLVLRNQIQDDELLRALENVCYERHITLYHADG